MRILIAIESDNNAKQLGAKTITWAPRSGFDLRIFIPEAGAEHKQILAYCSMIEDVNYNHYLDLSLGQIVIGHEPLDYAAKFNYDLVLLLPDNLTAWKANNDRNKMVLGFAAEIGKARKLMHAEPKLKQIDFHNGARLRRV